ncbi:PTS cellobiose transporter subunit IIC [Tetragenococcus osmophilus]|uniref:Permease IIC component n=1 Tax=Tetragenococcus osmophilus TaxID=526944 RepID=A0AA37XK08_9ENTE|nr:PTS transporter subunit EIIC [Tetragenococcus osmophilus]AYW48146.1 PTS cellobiose transporter subunit IIC [Tetragenococcus osmophilus]GMA53909.1 permease IIC component [Alicyclobacillus contaminans]GMA72182.1 permease IIC component [Tetragenococcus osmophilus]
MNVVFNFLENRLMPPLNRLANLRVIQAIMQAGVVTVPFTIVGSIFLIINNLPDIIPPLAPFFEQTILKLSPLYSVVTTMSIDSIAIFYALATAFYLTESYRQESEKQMSSFVGAILGLFAFLLTIIQVDIQNGQAQLLQNSAEDSIIYNGVALDSWVTRFSGVGIFIAIITSILAVQIYRFCMVKNVTIHMPEGVPDGVSKAFASLIPAIFIAITMVIINGILAFFHTDLHAILTEPFEFVKGLTGSWLGIVVIMLLIHLLWVVGVHGTAIIKNSFINPILLVALTENINGANNIFAGDFVNMYIFLGGAGSTLGLVLLMVFNAKSDQLKVLGRAAILPGLFNINEPVIFGAPIVYNPYLMIPFILAPIVNVTISYFAASVGLVNKIISGIPWISPVGTGAFLGTGGDFRGVFIAIINLAISILIYYPFFKMYDNKLYSQQK